MINFSLSRSTFYDTELSYSDLPSDLIEITAEKHTELLNALNSGCIIFSDLTCSSPQPAAHHNWGGENWIDPRSEEEKLTYKRSQYPKLTRYQFLRCLLENGFKASDIEAKIQMIEDEFSRELALLGFKEATNFVRTDESILAMQSVLGFSDENVDELWEYALKL